MHSQTSNGIMGSAVHGILYALDNDIREQILKPCMPNLNWPEIRINMYIATRCIDPSFKMQGEFL